MFSRTAGLKFVDRGDPAAFDFRVGDFIKDSVWYDLDLSSIVGAKACMVFVGGLIMATTGNESIQLRTKGNSDSYNIAERRANLVSDYYSFGVWVLTDANGVIQYKVSAGTYTVLDFIVRGWLA